MQKISEIFSPGATSLLQATRKAKEETREYNRKDPLFSPERPKRARFKLWVQFKDGNKRIFYSYDFTTENGKTVLDEWLGYTKLLRQLEKWEGKYKTAVIYCTLDPKADTNKKTYNQENIAGKFTMLYKRHNASIEFFNQAYKGINHCILNVKKFNTNYFAK